MDDALTPETEPYSDLATLVAPARMVFHVSSAEKVTTDKLPRSDSSVRLEFHLPPLANGAPKTVLYLASTEARKPTVMDDTVAAAASTGDDDDDEDPHHHNIGGSSRKHGGMLSDSKGSSVIISSFQQRIIVLAVVVAHPQDGDRAPGRGLAGAFSESSARAVHAVFCGLARRDQASAARLEADGEALDAGDFAAAARQQHQHQERLRKQVSFT